MYVLVFQLFNLPKLMLREDFNKNHQFRDTVPNSGFPPLLDIKEYFIFDPAPASWIKVVGMLPTPPPYPPTQNSPKLDH